MIKPLSKPKQAQQLQSRFDPSTMNITSIKHDCIWRTAYGKRMLADSSHILQELSQNVWTTFFQVVEPICLHYSWWKTEVEIQLDGDQTNVNMLKSRWKFYGI